VSTYPFPVHLDSKLCLTGVFTADEGEDPGPGETVFTLPFFDATLTKMVLSSAFGADAGTVLTVTPVEGDPDDEEDPVPHTITVAGDYSDGVVTVGRPFTSRLELSRPFVRDNRGGAVIDGEITVREIVVQHVDSCEYTVRSSYPSRADRSKRFTKETPETIGKTRVFMPGLADKIRFFIENDSPHPCTICSIDWTVDFATRRSQ
jgi:hypothetical protein